MAYREDNVTPKNEAMCFYDTDLNNLYRKKPWSFTVQ
jgi:hypothetical protein